MRLEKTKEMFGDAPEDLPQGITIQERMTGLKTWRNPSNKFYIARLHYSANPIKRGKEWKEKTRASYTWSEWMREYEIVFSSFKGVPVYLDDYSRAFHTSPEPLVWARELPVVRGWDFGLGSNGMACVWSQLISNFRLMVYKELTASDTDIEHFAEAVKQKSTEWFPGCSRYFDVVDPSGFNRTQVDKRACTDVIKTVLKTRPTPGAKSKVERRKAVTEFLKATVRGLPKVLIDLTGCAMLVEGFDGGYHYAYAKDGQLHDDPEKNEWSHSHDALQMICSRVNTLDLSAREPIQIATPRYAFGG